MIAQADRMAERSLSFEAALQDLGTLLHRIALAQRVPDAIAPDEPDRDAVLALAGKLPEEEVQLYYQIALQGRGDIGLAPDEYAGFTMTLLRMLAFAPEVGVPARSGNTNTGTGQKRAAQNGAPAPTATSPVNATRNESWESIAAALNLTGMTRQLAHHCAMTKLDANEIELSVPKAQEHMLEGAHQGKLKAALQQRFGSAFRVTFRIAAAAIDTPAAVETREKQLRQTQAAADIERDPFVKDLVENFGGRVKESSIKPLQ